MTTHHLAQWATSLQTSSIPPSVLSAARRSLYNYLGCAIGGSTHPAVTKAHAALSPLFGPGTSTLFGHQGPSCTVASTASTTVSPQKADPSSAALLNGISSHVHDYDDTHLATIIHPTGPIASALLAYIEYRSSPSYSPPSPSPQQSSNRSSSPKSTFPQQSSSSNPPSSPPPISAALLLLSLTLGIESSSRLGLSIYPSHYNLGWHITSTTGSIGAAIAVGKLMNLSTTQMMHAIGIAATQVTGLREMFGSDTKSFHPGRAAQNGLLAAMLAEKGFTAAEGSLEGARGWGNVVLGPGGELGFGEWIGVLQVEGESRKEEGKEEKAMGEGKRSVGVIEGVWETEKNAFKPFPCGIVVHPVIDASVGLYLEMSEQGKRVGEIESVTVRVHPLVLELTGKKEPKDGLEGKFSVYHGAAVGLVLGKAGVKEYEDEIVRNEEVVSVRRKVKAVSDETVEKDEAFVEVVFGDGEKLERHVRHAVGSLEVPMTDEQLEKKFVEQVELVVGRERAEEMSRLAWGIGEAEDVVGVIGRFQ